MAKVFISYRRTDSQDVAGRIVDRLADRFSHGNVFMDVNSIPIGVPYPELLRKTLSRTDVALVVIGPTWATVLDDSGNRRLDNPLDFVRIEVETALGSAALVVPVFVANAVMPDPRELPESLKPLTILNGISIRPDPDFHSDMDRLISQLEERLELEAQSDGMGVSRRRESPMRRSLEDISKHRMPTVVRIWILGAFALLVGVGILLTFIASLSCQAKPEQPKPSTSSTGDDPAKNPDVVETPKPPSPVGDWDFTFKDGKTHKFTFVDDGTMFGPPNHPYRGTWKQEGRRIKFEGGGVVPGNFTSWEGEIDSTGKTMHFKGDTGGACVCTRR